MWTPRRIGLLVIGFIVYLAAYLAYGRSHLGAIDGLPALHRKTINMSRALSEHTRADGRNTKAHRRSSSARPSAWTVRN